MAGGDDFGPGPPTIAPAQVGDAQGVIVLTPAVTAASLSGADDLLAIGRFGVGYDAVDVAACTDADVAVFITTGAVDRSVAEATVAWMLALTHHVRVKDALVREGRWDERSRWMGSELRERTLGVVGLGGIGRALVALLAGFGMILRVQETLKRGNPDARFVIGGPICWSFDQAGDLDKLAAFDCIYIGDGEPASVEIHSMKKKLHGRTVSLLLAISLLIVLAEILVLTAWRH